jgi:formylglycine-generating enzyme required for sulfatase activity
MQNKQYFFYYLFNLIKSINVVFINKVNYIFFLVITVIMTIACIDNSTKKDENDYKDKEPSVQIKILDDEKVLFKLSEKLPEHIVEKLKNLIDQEYQGKDDLIDVLDINYNTLILKYIVYDEDNKVYMINEDSLINLENDNNIPEYITIIAKDLLVNQKYKSENDLLNALNINYNLLISKYIIYDGSNNVYKVTKESLERLTNDNLADDSFTKFKKNDLLKDIIRKLRDLKNRKYQGKNEFVEAIETKLYYLPLILKNAEKIFDNSFNKLKNEGVPDYIIIKLEKLINQKYKNEDDFLNFLNLSEDEHNYDSLLLEKAEKKIFKLDENDLINLINASDIIIKLKKSINHEYNSKYVFLNSLDLNEEEHNLYDSLILQYAEKKILKLNEYDLVKLGNDNIPEDLKDLIIKLTDLINYGYKSEDDFFNALNLNKDEDKLYKSFILKYVYKDDEKIFNLKETFPEYIVEKLKQIIDLEYNNINDFFNALNLNEDEYNLYKPLIVKYLSDNNDKIFLSEYSFNNLDSFTRLAKDDIPEELIKKIRELKNRDYQGKDTFVDDLNIKMNYISTIFKNSDKIYNNKETTISLNGLVNDYEDGTLTGNSLLWNSNIDGEIGNGESLKKDDLSIGTHIITLTATDNNDNKWEDSIIIVIDTLPVAKIIKPLKKSFYQEDESLILKGEGRDALGNPIEDSLVWTSIIDNRNKKIIGTGTVLECSPPSSDSDTKDSQLSTGIHTITLTASTWFKLNDNLFENLDKKKTTIDKINISELINLINNESADKINLFKELEELSKNLSTLDSFFKEQLNRLKEISLNLNTDVNRDILNKINFLEKKLISYNGNINNLEEESKKELKRLIEELKKSIEKLNLELELKESIEELRSELDELKTELNKEITIKLKESKIETELEEIEVELENLKLEEITIKLKDLKNIIYTNKDELKNDLKIKLGDEQYNKYQLFLFELSKFDSDISSGVDSVLITVLEKIPDDPKNEFLLTNDLGMTFTKIPNGNFDMGESKLKNALPHEVTFTNYYYIQKTEVSQGQWKQVMNGDNPSIFDNCGDNCPVENVSWNDIKIFLDELNQMGIGRYRLPSEAEWEYASKARSTTDFANGEETNNKCDDSNLDQMGWYCGNSMWFELSEESLNKLTSDEEIDENTIIELSELFNIYQDKDTFLDVLKDKIGEQKTEKYDSLILNKTQKTGTHPVRLKQPNIWGLYDMHGNVYEWCEDWYENYQAEPVSNPIGPVSGLYKVIRGGCWNSYANNCWSTSRYYSLPDYKYSNIGFRLVRIN